MKLNISKEWLLKMAEKEAGCCISVGGLYMRQEKHGYEKPNKPGFYWALWIKAANGTHEGNELTPHREWEIVEVWENFTGEPCEADADEKFGVSVAGVRESQWLNNFVWGFGPIVNEGVERAKQRSQEIKELSDSVSKNRCPKCGSMLAHYRLHGLRCTNLSCPGPYGGGKSK